MGSNRPAQKLTPTRLRASKSRACIVLLPENNLASAIVHQMPRDLAQTRGYECGLPLKRVESVEGDAIVCKKAQKSAIRRVPGGATEATTTRGERR